MPSIEEEVTFYSALFQPLEFRYGKLDDGIITSIAGFDVGGPIRLRRKPGAIDGNDLFVTCELAIREEQVPSPDGRFELLAIGPDIEEWCRHVLTNVGVMSLESKLGGGHTIDASAWVPDDTLTGIVLETCTRTSWQGNPFTLLLAVGVTAPELRYARKHSVEGLRRRLVGAGIWPLTIPRRETVPGMRAAEKSRRTG